MKSLLLTPGFDPFLTSPVLEHTSFRFSGGELHVKLRSQEDRVRIGVRLNDADATLQLLLAVDALRRSGTREIEAFIPYLPYARQDRVMVKGEPLSIAVMARLLNGCGFSRLYVYDVHSDVSTALLDQAESISNHTLVRSVLKDRKDYWLVSPDAGALKKIYGVAQALDYAADIVLCHKLRDVSSGAIRQVTVDKADLEGRDCYIIDDICDGGATFIGIAKELKARNAGRVCLIVSHGIFSRGEEELRKWIDQVYTTDSISSTGSGYIERIPLCTLISFDGEEEKGPLG